MAEVVVFHHAQGLTGGVRKFADELRAEGHSVHTPDLYDGQTFSNLDEGVAHMKTVGFGTLMERSQAAARGLPEGLVYAGMSMGVGPAQSLAQTRPGAKGALLLYGALPASEFGEWPRNVQLQIHAMEGDEWFKEDTDAARELAALAGGELFLYPGDKHLFADSSRPDYEEVAARLLMQRVLKFLENI
ncbi:MAG TPA: dienelactone hydrolase family protein [Candidatus Dormibacteraeota bacterium]